MIELSVAIVTAVAGVLTSRGWPTLARRIKDHSAMVKDVPDDVAHDLKVLLAAEVAQLVAREGGRLDRRMDFLLNLRRGSWIAVFASLGLFMLLTGTWNDFAISTTEAATATMLGACASLSLVTAVIASSSVRVHRRSPPLQGSRVPVQQRR
ncbi:MAG: hypothetical protein ACXVF0_18795 [Blastococcus sp.]